MTHGLPFSDLDESRTRLEVHDSRALLERLSGRPVLGFALPAGTSHLGWWMRCRRWLPIRRLGVPVHPPAAAPTGNRKA